MSDAALTERPLPVGSIDRRSTGWWGMLTLILTEAALFVYLLFSYYYIALQYGRSWLPNELPTFKLSAPNTVMLILSSVVVWWGERGIKAGRRGQLVLGLIVGILLGAAFVGVQLVEWSKKKFTMSTSSYGSLYFTVTGFHMAHVVVGLIVLIALLVWALLNYFDSERHAPVPIGSIYWHFVDVVWLCVFTTFYITPYLS